MYLDSQAEDVEGQNQLVQNFAAVKIPESSPRKDLTQTKLLHQSRSRQQKKSCWVGTAGLQRGLLRRKASLPALTNAANPILFQTSTKSCLQ